MSSELLGLIVVTDEMAEVTGDRAWLQALLDAEAALAWAEAEEGLIPVTAAEAIGAAAHAERFDPAALGRAARLGGNPVIPLITALADAAGEAAAGWVHWGATSQDIMDTAQMLVADRALAVSDAPLTSLAQGCASLAEVHRRTLMVGRTLLQHALPITFGFQAATWLAGVLDAREQLTRARAGLAVQLGGACGTLASLGVQGPAVADLMAARLGLPAPLLPWHTSRQRVAALAGALATTAGTVAKISADVALLMQTEVAEVSEPWEEGRGASSTLPHKRNPVAAAAVGSATRQALALVPVLYGSLVAEHQRPVGAWQAEWETLGRLLALTGSAVAHTAKTVGGLEVHPDAMAANLGRTRGLVLAERVSMALADRVDHGQRVGSADAKGAVGEASRACVASGRSLADALADQPLVARLLDPSEVAELLEPSGYLGATDVWIDRALAAHATAMPGTVGTPTGFGTPAESGAGVG